MNKQPEIVRLTWDCPILKGAVEWLLSGASEEVVDLSDSCVRFWYGLVVHKEE